MIILGVVAAGALLGVVVVELSHYLAMRGVVASSRPGGSAQGRASEAVIVLGFPPRRDGRTNAVQRWRCRIAVRSLDPVRSSAIKIASDPFHVRKAHRYVARIRPDLVTRLEPARCYRPGEYLLLKAAILAHEIWSRARRRGIARRLDTLSGPVRRPGSG